MQLGTSPVFVALSLGENTILIGVFSSHERALAAVLADVQDTLDGLLAVDVAAAMATVAETLRSGEPEVILDEPSVGWSIQTVGPVDYPRF